MSLIGIHEYFENLYKHHFHNTNLSIREKMEKINEIISLHEEEVANPILEYLSNRDDLKLIGKNKIFDKNRAPTISFISNKLTSKKISEILVKNKIATRNDNFYAWRCLDALKIDTSDGVVRLSLTHYNSIDDVDKLLFALNKIN